MISLGCKTNSDCHGHGTCNQESGKCGCIDGYTGNTCEVSGKCFSINTFQRYPISFDCEIVYIIKSVFFERLF